MINNLPPELSQSILSLFNLKERFKLASVSRAWKEQVDDPTYWKSQLKALWPSFFCNARLEKIFQQDIDYKGLYILIHGLPVNIKNQIRREKKFDFKSVVKVISYVPQSAKTIFVSLIDSNETMIFFKSHNLYKILNNLQPEIEAVYFIYFSKYLKAFTNSGWMLHTCVGNVANKKAYLSLFNGKRQCKHI